MLSLSVRPALLVVSLLAVVFLTSACRSHDDVARVKDVEDSFEKRAWMDKAARALLYGTSKIDDELADALIDQPRAAIVDQLMKDPRFYSTVLDFNLYFLGLKKPTLQTTNGSVTSFNASGSRAAMTSAIAVLNDGDYFSLFDWEAKKLFLQAPLSSPDANFPEASAMTRAQIQAHWLGLAKSRLTAWIEEVQQSTDLVSLCAKYNDIDNGETYIGALQKAALPDDLERIFEPASKAQLLCGALGGVAPDPSAKDQILAEGATLFAELDMVPDVLGKIPEAASTLADVVAVDPGEFPTLKQSGGLENFDIDMWLTLTNSSTNFNRRRAAYMLRTFFCDDLTPLNIVAPAAHAADKHAADPSCAACHYKLDPMAGFFRSRGIVGVDFTDLPLFVHDDQLVRTGADMEKYFNTWKAPATSSRAWDVGYIRSPDDETLNSYGEKLEDLFKIVRQAPETKMCLTKRLAEYTLSVNQVYDGNWLQSLAQNFVDATKPDAAPNATTVALKSVMKALVLSKTFATSDPVKGQCYDFAPGATASGLPCAVAFIVEKNCTASCHKGASAPNGLDLTQWVKKSDGSMGFAHINKATGAEIPAAVSFQRILDALSTNDTDAQMPLGQYMDPVERATLFKFVKSQSIGGQP